MIEYSEPVDEVLIGKTFQYSRFYGRLFLLEFGFALFHLLFITLRLHELQSKVQLVSTRNWASRPDTDDILSAIQVPRGRQVNLQLVINNLTIIGSMWQNASNTAPMMQVTMACVSEYSIVCDSNDSEWVFPQFFLLCRIPAGVKVVFFDVQRGVFLFLANILLFDTNTS